MNESTLQTHLLRYAITSWRLMNGHPVEPLDYRQAMLFVTGDHRGNFTDRVGPLMLALQNSDMYASQPSVPGLIKKWKSSFEPAVTLSVQDASDFLQESASALDLVDEIFSDHSLSGVTKMVQDTATDVEIRRPAGKLSGWSLNLTVSGRGHYSFMRHEIQTSRGDLMLLSPQAMYDCRRAGQTSHWTHSWIFFQPHPRLIDWFNWQEVGPHIYHLKLPDDEFTTVDALFDSTLDFDPTESKLSEALLLNITEQVLIRCSQYSKATGRPMIDIRVQQAMDYISSNLDRSFSVQDVARHVRLSRTQLSSLFKEHTGSTLFGWREERRIAQASQLLTQTALQIQEIAERIGYDDPLYFSRTFTRLVGCSPRQYRKGQ
ncbi:MAG: arabinose operon transcriptional regulator AraC [Halioglobus sp.]